MKKIMFDNHYGLEDAVLNGTKTMTRRVVTKDEGEMKGIEKFVSDTDDVETSTKYIIQRYARYKVGEVVAIAQSYHTLNKSGFVAPEWLEHTCESSAGYKNKMFVRADLMPHQIHITDVRVERLQDISDEDCMKEGIERRGFEESMNHPKYVYGFENKEQFFGFLTPREAFHHLICKISGKNIWINNPYVFVYSFKLIK